MQTAGCVYEHALLDCVHHMTCLGLIISTCPCNGIRSTLYSKTKLYINASLIIYIYVNSFFLKCVVCDYPSFPVNGATTLSNMSVAASHTLDHCICPSYLRNERFTSCTASTVTYTCNSGYVNFGSSQQRCQSGSYGWSWPPPSCANLISKWVNNRLLHDDVIHQRTA